MPPVVLPFRRPALSWPCPLVALPGSPSCWPLAFRRLAGLGGAFLLGLLLQFLGCALWHNWWPMLTAFVYVLVPMVRLDAVLLLAPCRWLWQPFSRSAAGCVTAWCKPPERQERL